MDKEVLIRFKGEDIKKMLIDKTGIAEDLAQVIIGNLAHSNVGFEQVTKALLGIFPKADYKVGDFIYVAVESLPSWRVDKEACKKMDSCTDGCLMAQIIKVDLYTTDIYQVSCKAVLSDGKTGDLDWRISESDIKGVPENPAEILELMENLDKELPF